MKLIITYYGRQREQLWSGTLDVFYKILPTKTFIEKIEWVRIFPDISTLYQKLLTLYSRLFYTSNGICRERQMYFKTVKTAKQKLLNKECDWVLMVAEHCLDESFPYDKKYACYIDTDFPATAKMDFSSKKKGYNYYISNYDKYTAESYKRMDIIFTQNEWTKESIIKRFNLNPAKVINVRFGVNIEPYYGKKDYNNNLLLIVLRQFNDKVKGLDIIIGALPKIREKYPNTRLAIVGNDKYKGVEGVETYVGYPRDKTKELFKEATLYVMPSRNEPNGITYLEALCNKTPFVALNRFSTPEFSNNGEWSFLCDSESPNDLANIVIKALSNKERLKTMGIKGQDFVVKNYQWKKVISEMCNIMKEKI